MFKLYQTEWNGISLSDIARDPNCFTDGGPNAKFYAEFYSRLRKLDFQLPSSWVEKKGKISNELRSWINLAASSLNRDPREVKVLSISAGLGIVELPLIKEGYDITLHEITPEPFEYLGHRNKGEDFQKIKTCIGPIESLLVNSFDLVFLGCCEYCLLTDVDYLEFLEKVARLPRPGGRVIAWDFIPAIGTLKNNIPFFKRQNRGILWGNMRSPVSRVSYFERTGLILDFVECFDSSWSKKTKALTSPSLLKLMLNKYEIGVLHFLNPQDNGNFTGTFYRAR